MPGTGITPMDIAIRQDREAGPPPPSDWILNGGTWHDDGVWEDDAVWED